MKFFDRWIGRTALSRAEALIADKRDEISRVTKAQLDDVRSIQKEIDGVEGEIFKLKKDKQRLQTKAEAAIHLGKERLSQLQAELKELEAHEETLRKQEENKERQPTTYTIKDGVVEFRAKRSDDDEPMDFTPGRKFDDEPKFSDQITN